MMQNKKTGTGFVIQARTGSTRLPGKVLLPFYERKSILEIIIDKLKSAFDLTIVLATTDQKEDDPIMDLGEAMSVSVFRGSEHNVLDRFIGASQSERLENVMRICADNPFLEIESMKKLLDTWDEGMDYLSFQTEEGTPVIKTHYGFFTEMVSLSALQKTAQLTDEPLYLEHVTNYVYGHRDIFNVCFIDHEELCKEGYRLTVDTEDDFETGQLIYRYIHEKHGAHWTVKDIFAFIDGNEAIKKSMEVQIALNSK